VICPSTIVNLRSAISAKETLWVTITKARPSFKVEKWMLSDKGRKFKVYRSRISKADISIRKPEPTLTLVRN